MTSEHDGMMVRIRIQLTTTQHEDVECLAARRGVSMAQVVREGVEAMIVDYDNEEAGEQALVDGDLRLGGADVERVGHVGLTRQVVDCVELLLR